MKMFKTFLVAGMVIISASSFRAGDPVPPTVISPIVSVAFEKNFTSASGVRWEKVSNNYIASFKIHDDNLLASYSEDGELLVTSRIIKLSQIPLIVNLALQQNYPKFTFGVVVTEVIKGSESFYVIKGSDNKKIITLHASPSGNLSVEDISKKK